MKFSFRPHWLLLCVLSFLLIACGNDEPEQRAAFTQFLQTRIINKPGLHIPKLTPEESKSFGEYADHYAVITDFNSALDSSMKSIDTLLQKGAIRSLNDLISRRDDIQAAQQNISEMSEQVKQIQAKADSAHQQLKQPEDLKAVYDKAYDRTVSIPANTLIEILPQISNALNSSLKVADYISAHKAQIEISGSMARVQDPKVQAELNEHLQDLNSHGKTMMQAYARIQTLITGR